MKNLKILVLAIIFCTLPSLSPAATTFRLHADKATKATIVDADVFFMEDSEAGWATKGPTAAQIKTYVLADAIGIEVDSTLSTSGTNPVTIGLSTASKTKEVCWLIKNVTTDTAVADGLEAFVVPASLNGMNLVDLTCAVADLNSAASDATTVVLRRVRGATAADMTSVGVTINYDEYSASDETVDTANDDLATGDKIYVDVNAVTTAVQKGLGCTASFRLP